MIIYLITNKQNGKVYVGQTIKSLSVRWSNHLSSARDGVQYLYRAIRKWGESSFEVAQIASAEDKEQLDNLEKIFIILLRSNDENFGYNLTAGGDGLNKPSPETLVKMRISHLGKKQSQAAKDKVSKANQGRVITWGSKISEAKMGHPVSDETRKKCSVANRGRKHLNRKKPIPRTKEHTGKIVAGLRRAYERRRLLCQ